MNIRGIVEKFDTALAATGYVKDLSREGTAPPPSKSYRLVVESFSTAVETGGAAEFNSCEAAVTVILSRAGFGGRPEDATIELAEAAETLASQIMEWFDLNGNNTLKANFVEARAYLGEGKLIKMAVSFEVHYDFSEN